MSGFTIMLFLVGSLVNMLTYQSIAPIAVALIFFLVAQTFLIFTPLGGEPEQYIFSRVYSINFVIAGIAAIYANQLSDPFQTSSDPAYFFEMAVSEVGDRSLVTLITLDESALAIFLWSLTYKFFYELGFDQARYVGVALNSTFVAFSGVLGVKIIRQIFGNDHYRFRRLTHLVGSCGLFWIFAGIHLRDSAVLLVVTTLAYFWVHYLAKPLRALRVVNIAFWSLFAGICLTYLRLEFVFVPFAMAIVAIASILLAKDYRSPRLPVLVLSSFAGVAIIGLVFSNLAEFSYILWDGQEKYNRLTDSESRADSLGYSLIIEQPAPFRLLIGSIYLYLFPIPFWSGFQLESAHHFFKSAHALYVYFVLPLIMIALLTIVQVKQMRSSSLLFFAMLFPLFTAAVALTSLESRHLGAFFLLTLVLAVIPDLRAPPTMRRYKRYLLSLLAGVLIVHVVWFCLKFLRF